MSTQNEEKVSSRVAFCEDAPTFRPTQEEFSDPLRYISSIRDEAERFGVCRIQPPKTAREFFTETALNTTNTTSSQKTSRLAIDASTFSVQTRVQTVNELNDFEKDDDDEKRDSPQGGKRRKKNRSGFGQHETLKFRQDYCQKMGAHFNRPIERWPTFLGKKLDVQKLYELVNTNPLKGFETVKTNKQWRDIARVLDPGMTQTRANDGTSNSFSLKCLYKKWVLPFEKMRRKEEDEEKKKNEENEEERGGKGGKASSGKGGGAANSKEETTTKEEEPTEEEKELIGAMLDLEFRCSRPAPKRPKLENGLEEIAEQLEIERMTAQSCKHCGQSGHDDEETFLVCDGCDQGFHTYCLSPPLQKVPEGKWFCVGCEAAARAVEFEDGAEYTIDGFREACAAFDLAFFGRNNPQQTQMLLAQQQQYGSFTIPCGDVEESFWQMVEEGSHENVEVRSAAEIDTTRRGSGFPRMRDAPSSFATKKKSGGGGDDEEEDNNDGNNDKMEEEEEDEMVAKMRKSPWNLNNLPVLRGPGEHESLLASLPEHVAGLSQPYLYVGSTFASTCWHVEENNLYSVTYQHAGAAKMWYAIPAASCEAMENSFKRAVPDLFGNQLDAMIHVVTMLPPSTLRNDNVPVFRVEQNPGDFIVTFPKSYHAQVDCGFNVSEKVNFAPPDWLSHGTDAVERYRSCRKLSMFCHERLLCDSADTTSPKLGAEDEDKDEGKEEATTISENTARWLLPELRTMMNEERQAREQLAADGTVRSKLVVDKKKKKKSSSLPSSSSSSEAEAVVIVKKPKEARLRTSPRTAEDDPECTICRSILHLSGVVCKCNIGRKACLRHCAELCECAADNRVLFYRKTLEDIEKLVSTVEKSTSAEHRKQINADFKPVACGKARITKANAWVKKVKQALEKAPMPEIADLQSLAVAGEEFVWGGSEMAETRKLSAKIALAKKWQVDLTVLKARMNGEELTVGDVMLEDDLSEEEDDVEGGEEGETEKEEREDEEEKDAEGEAAEKAPAGADDNDAMVIDGEKKGDREDAGATATTTANVDDEQKVSKKDRIVPRMKLDRLEELLSTKPVPMTAADLKSYTNLKSDAENIEKRVADALKEQPYPSPRTCEKLLKDSTKISVEIPSHHRLFEQIQKATKWAEKVRAALPGRAGRTGRGGGRASYEDHNDDGDDTAATLVRIHDLDELEKESHGLPVSSMELQTLIKAREETHTWRARAISLLDTKNAPLHDAEMLFNEGKELGVYCDEITTMETAVDDAYAWVNKALKMDTPMTSIDELKTHLEASKALAITVTESTWLKNRITVRQWAEDIKNMLLVKDPIDDAIKAVKEGEELLDSADYEVAPDEEKLLISLKGHVDAGKKWEVKGRQAVQCANSKREADRKSLDEVAQIVREGASIPLKLEGFDFLQETVNTTKAWLERAQPCLKGKQLTRRGTAQPLPTLEEAKQLVKEAPDLRIYVKEVAALIERVEDAESWNEEAEDCVSRWREEGAEITFKELELSHEDFGLELPAMATVRKRLRALDWEEKARECFASILERIEGTAGTSEKGSGKSSKASKKQEEEEEDLPEDALLDELHEEAEDLDELNPKLLEEVNKRWKLVDEWRQKADAMLNPELDENGRPKQTIGPDELDALISEGKNLPAIVAKVDELEANLANHQVWFTAARELLASAPVPVAAAAGDDGAAGAKGADDDGKEQEKQKRRPFSDFKDLLKEVESEGDAFMCPERAQLTAVVTRCEEWNDNLRMALLRRPVVNASTPPTVVGPAGEESKQEEVQLNSKQVLQTILESIHAAILDVTGTGIPPETEDGQFCLCRQAGGVQMLGCDDCGDWYHLKCINISASAAKTMNNYVCAPCVAKNGKPKALSLETYKSVHRTKRPNILALKRALQESVSFPCEMPEEELIIEIVNAHDAWCLRVRECLHNHHVLETSTSAETQAAHIARATTRREAEARARKVNEAQMRGANPHNAELTAIQHVMLMGQSVTAAATQRTIALQGAQANPTLLSEELKNITINQLTLLQQFGVQLALCQAQLHMAPAISHPHIVHVLILRDRHAKLMEQLAVELKKDDGEQQILAAITQAMDPNAQVAVPPSVAAANVDREAAAAAAAAAAAKEKDDSKGKEEPSPEEDVKKEAGEAPAAAPPPEKPAPPVKGGKKGKAAAKGKKGAKGKKVAEEVEAPAPEAADKEEEAVKEEDAATPMDVGKDAQAAQAAQAAAIAAQAAMQQQFAQQQQFQQQHDQQFLVHQQQQLQMMGAMQPQPGQEQMFAAATAQHQLSGTGPDGTQQPVGIDLKKQIFAGMKGALAMELEPVEETLAMMREVCGPAWRQRATSLMRGPPFPKLIELHELKETAVAAGLCPGGGVDPLADRAFALESAGQLWLEHAATVVEDKSIPIEAARVLLREGRALPVHLKDELEELGERCELYCVCRSAYDAKRSMICCDRCDGWFHYECIGMQPPGLDEQEEANIKFACPQCCENQGIPYVPFRPLR